MTSVTNEPERVSPLGGVRPGGGLLGFLGAEHGRGRLGPGHWTQV